MSFGSRTSELPHNTVTHIQTTKQLLARVIGFECRCLTHGEPDRNGSHSYPWLMAAHLAAGIAADSSKNSKSICWNFGLKFNFASLIQIKDNGRSTHRRLRKQHQGRGKKAPPPTLGGVAFFPLLLGGAAFLLLPCGSGCSAPSFFWSYCLPLPPLGGAGSQKKRYQP